MSEAKDLFLRKKIMWLPKDERDLLAYYYIELGQVGIKDQFFLSELAKCLRKSDESTNRVRTANQTLDKRNLIALMPPQGGAVTLSLTLAGYDLGRKYNCWWTRSKLWYDEYIKDHWIWLVISFVGGVIISLLVNWLSSFFGAK